MTSEIWLKLVEDYENKEGTKVTHYKRNKINRCTCKHIMEDIKDFYEVLQQDINIINSKEAGYAFIFYYELYNYATIDFQERHDRLLWENEYEKSFPDDFSKFAKVPPFDVLSYIKKELKDYCGRNDYLYIFAGDPVGPKGIAISWDFNKNKLVRLTGKPDMINAEKKIKFKLTFDMETIDVSDNDNVKDMYQINNVSSSIGIINEEETCIDEEELERIFWITMFNKFTDCSWHHNSKLRSIIK